MKKKYWYVLVFVVSVFAIFWLSICYNTTYATKTQIDTKTDIHYIKDTRTGLCFAKRALWCTDYSLSDNYSFAQVPCSAEVEGLIGK